MGLMPHSRRLQPDYSVTEASLLKGVLKNESSAIHEPSRYDIDALSRLVEDWSLYLGFDNGLSRYRKNDLEDTNAEP